MHKANGRFWARKSNLEKLYGARYICLVPTICDDATEIASVFQLVASLENLSLVKNRILVVVVLSQKDCENHGDPIVQHQDISADACCLYHFANEEDGQASLGGCDDLVEIDHPPAARFQTLVCAESLDESRWKTALNLMEEIEDWLSAGSSSAGSTPLFILMGRCAAAGLAGSRESKRAAKLLDRASAIVMRDKESLETVGERFGAGISSKAFVLGSDSLSCQSPPSGHVTTAARSMIQGEPAPLGDPEVALLLYEWLLTSYVANLEKAHQTTVEKLLQSLKQLSDIQFEYERLLTFCTPHQNRELQELRERVGIYETAVRFQIANRINDLLARNSVAHRVVDFAAKWALRLMK